MLSLEAPLMVTIKSAGQKLGFAGLGSLCLSSMLACTAVIGSERTDTESSSAPPGGASLVKGQDPGSKGMHRLNSAEYNNTVADVLGTALAPASSLWANEEDLGFDNIASVLRVDDKQFQKYFDAAGAIADDVFANVSLKARFVTCATADDMACVQGVINAFGLHLFRRPLIGEEVANYQAVYAASRTQGEDHDGSLKQVLRALLSSAEFLYRIEIDPDPASLASHALDPYELAARMSYFLWSSAPDDALLAAAADGSLAADAALTSAVDRMLADAKGDRFVRNFAGQWLGVRKVQNHGVSPAIFPDWTPALAAAMAEEVYQLFGEFARTDRSWLDFLKADVNFVDANLAALYDLPAPPQGIVRVEEKSDGRFGFFGTGAFLALSSYEYRTAPTLRGRWILINLLCTPPKDPPPGVPELDADPTSPDASEQNVRQRLEEHRQNATCAGCHAELDPYGIALENFDAIGKYRTTYRNGSPIDVNTTLSDGTAFTGLQGLADVVSAKEEYTQCITQKLFTYGLGRGVQATDQPYIDNIRANWVKQTPTLRNLIHGLISADTFRFRHAAH